jgi:hypothetical protein
LIAKGGKASSRSLLSDTAMFTLGPVRGIPLTASTNDALVARHNLELLSALYPGQIFVVESNPENADELVVCWIPGSYLPGCFGNLILNNFAALPPLEWPE